MRAPMSARPAIPPSVPATIAPVRASVELLPSGASGDMEGSVDVVVEEAVVVDVPVVLSVEAEDSVEAEEAVRDALVLVITPSVVGVLSRIVLLVKGTDIRGWVMPPTSPFAVLKTLVAWLTSVPHPNCEAPPWNKFL